MNRYGKNAPQAAEASGKNRCQYDQARQGDRFLQTDPVGSDDDLDLYAYVGGDPVNKADPTGTIGLDWRKWLEVCKACVDLIGALNDPSHKPTTDDMPEKPPAEAPPPSKPEKGGSKPEPKPTPPVGHFRWINSIFLEVIFTCRQSRLNLCCHAFPPGVREPQKRPLLF